MADKVRPVKVNGYSNKGRLALKDRLRQEGEARNQKWRDLTPQQQLQSLDKRGLRATRQRMKLGVIA